MTAPGTAIGQAQAAVAGGPPRPDARILVRGVNWLGDAVMTTPALLRLRAAFPTAHISLLTPEKLGDLWQHHPAVDAVLLARTREPIWHVARGLRQNGFDLGLVFPNSPRSALELWLAGVPRRVGYAARWRRWLLTHALPDRPAYVPMRKRAPREVRRVLRSAGGNIAPPLPETAHHLHHYLHLVGALGADPSPVAPQLTVLEDELEAVSRRFELGGADGADGPLLGLNAGAEYGPAKRWPRASFVAAARRLQEQTGCRWVILGGMRDADLASGIASELVATAPAGRVVNLAGRTSLRELCAVLKLCRVVLTNDTGPMHVAAAVGTPVVVPFGSTSPELTGPGLPGDPRHRLLTADAACRPCFQRHCPIDLRCLTLISVDRAVGAVLELLPAR